MMIFNPITDKLVLCKPVMKSQVCEEVFGYYKKNTNNEKIKDKDNGIYILVAKPPNPQRATARKYLFNVNRFLIILSVKEYVNDGQNVAGSVFK